MPIRPTLAHKALLFAGGTLAALLVAEIAVRLSGLAPEVAFIEKGRFRLSPNPGIGYEPVPGLDYSGEELSFFDYRGRSNSLGYRDSDHPLRKSPGTYRIVVLGDSIAAGLKVLENDRIFPVILERDLRARGLPVEVINFGVSGYNTRQEVETFKEKGLPFEPDLVLLGYCLNDTDRPGGGLLEILLEEGKRRRSLDPARINRYLATSAAYRFLRYRALAPAGENGPGADLPKDTVERSLEELSRLARQGGFEVLVAVFPAFENLEAYAHTEHHEVMRALSAAEGFHHLDLLPAFRRCAAASSEPVGFDPFHPTPYGHLCAANAMADSIVASIVRQDQR
jgi:lysophospholipase L1-like esterase